MLILLALLWKLFLNQYYVISFVIKDLYKSLKILSAELVPWHTLKKQDENEGIKVEDLLFIVDTMLEEVENKEKVMPNTHVNVYILM